MLTVNCLRACLEDKPNDHTLDDLWEDTVMRKHLLEISRFTRRRAGRNKKSAKSKSSRALIDLKAVQKIDPPPARTLYQWLNDSTSFPTIESLGDRRPQTLQHAYKATIALEDHNASYIVALRFYHLLFFDVGKRLEPTKEKVNSSLAASVADRLISLGLDKVDLDRIKRWIVVGSIYNDLIEVFGEGCLFFLPTEISFTGWLLLGSKIPEVVAHLEGIEIRHWIERFETAKMGRTIRQSLLLPVQDHFQASIDQDLGIHAAVTDFAPGETRRTLPSSVERQPPGIISENSQGNSGSISQTSANTAVQFEVGLPSTEITEVTADWIAASDFPFTVDFTPATNFDFMSVAFAENLGGTEVGIDSNVPYLPAMS